MPVSEFLARWDRMAAGTPPVTDAEAQVLRSAMQGAADAYRAEVEAARATSARPRSCPPPKGQASITSEDLLKGLRAVPAAQQPRTELKDAFAMMMDARYPCK